MKKRILYRIVAVTLFCSSSLLVNSGLSACKPKCKNQPKKIASILKRPAKKEVPTVNAMPRDGFFIKI
jgi:hypothetical protein